MLKTKRSRNKLDDNIMQTNLLKGVGLFQAAAQVVPQDFCESKDKRIMLAESHKFTCMHIIILFSQNKLYK